MLIQADSFYLPYRSNYFHAIVTSPPYWGLRKYQGDQGEEPLGLEATPERHIQRMVEVFREVRRVLRDDGVVWLNYGDCYGGSGGGHKDNTGQSGLGFSSWEAERGVQSPKAMMPGNLMLMPHRLAIALQDDGWIVRNDLVWFKRNPMPESVAGWRWERRRTKTKEGNTRIDRLDREKGKASWTVFGGKGTRRTELDNPEYEYSDDYVLRKSSWRHTRAHEYVFQLVKKMGYYCNQEAVREITGNEINPDEYEELKRTKTWESGRLLTGNANPGYTAGRSHPGGRNPRSVLDVPTAPYKGAHYATFPPKLIAPLIRASVPRRCCPECGMAWAPVVEKGSTFESGSGKAGSQVGDILGKHQDIETLHSGDGHDVRLGPTPANTVTDYRPTCECGVTQHEPGIVLDIFGGSGTTGAVAKQLLRRWVVMDISKPYLDEQAKVRTGTGTPSKALDGLPMFEDLE